MFRDPNPVRVEVGFRARDHTVRLGVCLEHPERPLNVLGEPAGAGWVEQQDQIVLG